MSASFLVLCPFGLDEGLLCKAVELSGTAPVRILLPEHQSQTATKYGAKLIHTIPDEFRGEDEAEFARWLSEKVMQWNATVILAPASVQMRGILPMMAWRLNAGLTADCTALTMDADRLIQTRPAFGNSLMADIRTTSEIQMATVRPGTFRCIERQVQDAIIVKEIPSKSVDVKVKTVTEINETAPLNQARIIFAGGVGIGSLEGFRKLEKLALLLGGAVAASRGAVDAGFAPYRCQVGMTGVTVCPDLYIAVGISGAVQHLAGMSGAGTVVAINSDPKAPIFDYADYGIVGNWESVIEHVLEELL